MSLRLSALCGIELRPDSVGTGRAELPAEIYTAAHQEMGSHLWFCCVALGMLLIACIQIDARPKSGEALQTTASSRNTNTTLRESLQEQRYFKLKPNYTILFCCCCFQTTKQTKCKHHTVLTRLSAVCYLGRQIQFASFTKEHSESDSYPYPSSITIIKTELCRE